jgi:hypothetical protein
LDRTKDSNGEKKIKWSSLHSTFCSTGLNHACTNCNHWVLATGLNHASIPYLCTLKLYIVWGDDLYLHVVKPLIQIITENCIFILNASNFLAWFFHARQPSRIKYVRPHRRATINRTNQDIKHLTTQKTNWPIAPPNRIRTDRKTSWKVINQEDHNVKTHRDQQELDAHSIATKSGSLTTRSPMTLMASITSSLGTSNPMTRRFRHRQSHDGQGRLFCAHTDFHKADAPSVPKYLSFALLEKQLWLNMY